MWPGGQGGWAWLNFAEKSDQAASTAVRILCKHDHWFVSETLERMTSGTWVPFNKVWQKRGGNVVFQHQKLRQLLCLYCCCEWTSHQLHRRLPLVRLP